MSEALDGQTALVTGASQGIGLAIAGRLARVGMQVWMVARRADVLENAARSIAGNVQPHAADLSKEEDRTRLIQAMDRTTGSLDVLVHSAGVIHLGPTVDTAEDLLIEQLESNVVGPYALTRALLPSLQASRGQIVFINSSAGINANPGAGQYCATQHAMRAFAQSLRGEVNEHGVRVTVVHPGRTATPRQAAIFASEGRPYCPELLMQASDVAEVVGFVLGLPRTAEVTEVSMRSMLKSY